MGRTVSELTVGLAALLVLSACSGCSGPNSSGEQKLSGSGSSFVKPIMDKWIDVYLQGKPNTQINYQSQGSSAGVKQMTEKAVDFGCSDFFLSKEQIEKADAEGGEVIHIPLVMGGVVPAYNLPGVDRRLRFSGAVLADIFAGDIQNWSHERIKADNPGANLPDLKISVVHRLEGSGTTAIFTEYLSTVSDKWKDRVGATISWPVGNGEKGNPAVANAISKNPGSIGYVELLYALQKKDVIQFGEVKDKAGDWVLASIKSVRAAASSVEKYPDDLRFSLVKECKGKGAYPISGTTWAVIYAKQSGDRGRALVDFLTWIVHDGQKEAEGMYYTPLPEKLIKKIEERLKKITVQ